MTEFKMPSLGADMEAGTLVEWRKKPGDLLQPGDIIAEVDTQKGLIEIEVFESGILEKYLIAEGDLVPVGTSMATIRTEGSAGETVEKPAEEIHPIQEKEQTKESKSPAQAEEISEGKDVVTAEIPSEGKPSEAKPRIKVSPLARNIAEKNNIDLTTIKGTGENGAITKTDVEKVMAAKQVEKPEKPEEEKIWKQPKEGFATKQETGKTVPLTLGASQESVRNAVAAAMSLSNREIPHYYLEKKVDMFAAMSWLKETNQKLPIARRLLPVALFIKAIAKAIENAPQLNAVWDNGLQIKNEINIGFVVSLRSGGVIVPAIHNADMKNPEEIMAALNDLIPRARSLRLRSSELSESTITLTSLGENGADKVFGVIYPPQVAVIGFGSVVNEAVAYQDMLAIRPVVHVTLAGDHRATDGLTGSRFLEALNNHLQNPQIL